jgi:hypothetical protein
MHSPYLPQISFLVLNELCLKNTIYLPEPVMNELKVMNELSLFKESTSGSWQFRVRNVFRSDAI